MAIKISNRAAKECALNDIKKCCKKGETYLFLIDNVNSLPFKKCKEQLISLSTPHRIINY